MQFHIPYHVYSDKYPSKRLAVYHAIRDCITSEVLVMNTRLPSSRKFPRWVQLVNMVRNPV